MNWKKIPRPKYKKSEIILKTNIKSEAELPWKPENPISIVFKSSNSCGFSSIFLRRYALITFYAYLLPGASLDS